MCRYAMTTYKAHYACFNCRKTFKRRLLKDLKRNNTDAATKCPQCGELTADMGLDFKSPRQTDVKSWEHMKNLHTVGQTFHSCGCSGPGYIPDTTEKLLEYLEKRKADYLKHLQFWLNRNANNAEIDLKDIEDKTSYYSVPEQLRGKNDKNGMMKAIEYWNNKLADLENRMRSLAV